MSNVVIPLAVFESDLSPASKIGFGYFLYTCGRDQCDSLRGSYRALAKTLHIAKSSFIRSVPLWAEKGWVTLKEEGKELILTLVAVPIWDRVECNQDTSSVPAVPQRDTIGPNRDTFLQDSAENGPNRDKNDPSWDTFPPNAGALSVILPITSNLLLKDTNNVITPIIFHPQEDVPELTTDLALALVSRVLPVPERPKGGAALERWMLKYYQPMSQLIERQRPVAGPQAWGLIDLVTRYMAWAGSGWMQRIGGLPTLQKVLDTWDMQMAQIGRLHWQPDETTPYPGCPAMGHEAQEEATLQDDMSNVREAQPFAPGKLKLYAQLLLSVNPELLLSRHVLPDGSGRDILLVKVGPGKSIGIDAEIWENPTPDEEQLLFQAIEYGNALQQERQTVAIAQKEKELCLSS